MEKKLTDEEIAKAILQSIEYSKTITYFDEWGNFKSIFVKDALDLIHRLQDENERLTEWKDKLQDTKDELEQQLIDTGFKEYCEENKRLTEENAELQKQVDELKQQFLSTCENCHLKKDIEMLRYKKEQAVKDTAKEILQEAENLLHECAMEYANAGHKDYFGVCENISWKVIRKIAKDKGVEVE